MTGWHFANRRSRLHERWGGQLYWHDGGHAGHLFSRRVQAASEQFLGELTG